MQRNGGEEHAMESAFGVGRERESDAEKQLQAAKMFLSAHGARRGEVAEAMRFHLQIAREERSAMLLHCSCVALRVEERCTAVAGKKCSLWLLAQQLRASPHSGVCGR
jgi:hypothetical protein